MTVTRVMKLQAESAGRAFAADEIRAGAAQPDPSPLSGEWADALTPELLALQLGYPPRPEIMSGELEDARAFDMEDLAQAYEDGYMQWWDAHFADQPVTLTVTAPKGQFGAFVRLVLDSLESDKPLEAKHGESWTVEGPL